MAKPNVLELKHELEAGEVRSPNGVAYSVCIKPATISSKKVLVYSPPNKKSCDERLKIADERRQMLQKMKENEEEAKTQRALKAKQQHQEYLETRKKLAEMKLAQMKQVEEKRLANTKAIIEKAKQDLEKVEYVRTVQQQKVAQLDERIRQNLIDAEEKRKARFSEISEKCARHVENARKNAELVKMNKCS